MLESFLSSTESRRNTFDGTGIYINDWDGVYTAYGDVRINPDNSITFSDGPNTGYLFLSPSSSDNAISTYSGYMKLRFVFHELPAPAQTFLVGNYIQGSDSISWGVSFYYNSTITLQERNTIPITTSTTKINEVQELEIIAQNNQKTVYLNGVHQGSYASSVGYNPYGLVIGTYRNGVDSPILNSYFNQKASWTLLGLEIDKL